MHPSIDSLHVHIGHVTDNFDESKIAHFGSPCHGIKEDVGTLQVAVNQRLAMNEKLKDKAAKLESEEREGSGKGCYALCDGKDCDCNFARVVVQYTLKLQVQQLKIVSKSCLVSCSQMLLSQENTQKNHQFFMRVHHPKEEFGNK